MKSYSFTLPKMTKPDSLLNRVYVFLIAACCLTVLFQTLSLCYPGKIWDDAYMYARYAHNILAQGKAVWNPGGEVTYGFTSPFYLLLVLAVRSWLFSLPTSVVIFSSLLSGAGFLALLLILLNRHMETGREIKSAFILLLFFYLAVSCQILSTHLVSGMDTAFVLMYITGYIIIAREFEKSPTAIRAVIMGTVGGFAYFARPDLMLYSLAVPAAMIFFDREEEIRRKSRLVLKVSLGVLAAELVFVYYFFETPFPLPFYVKSFRYYGEFIYNNYQEVAGKELSRYLNSYQGLFLIIGAGWFMSPRQWWREGSSLDKGLLTASFLFILYYRFFVLQIMHLHARFYFPTFPALVFLASRSVVAITRKIPSSFKQELKKLPQAISLAAIFFLLPFVLISLLATFNNFRSSISRNNLGNLDPMTGYKRNWNAVWLILDKFSGLPDDLVIAATEVGYPGILNPDKTIIDLAGLNETGFALQGFSADTLFKKYNPDLIYMPHPHYTKMIDEITKHPDFVNNYLYFPREKLGWAILGIAIRKTSKYYSLMRQMLLHDLEIHKGRINIKGKNSWEIYQ